MHTENETDLAAQAIPPAVYAAIELSRSKWIVALKLPHADKVSLFTLEGGDARELIRRLETARAKAARWYGETVEVRTCFEAGYDGFWLHRLLESRNIHNRVLDSASIQVSRRRRKVKTDRTDAESLIRLLRALDHGEHRICSVVEVPTPEAEDAKRLVRSRRSLLLQRIRHTNRIRGLLNLQGVRHIDPSHRDWTADLNALRTADGRSFPPQLLREIQREARLLAVVTELLKEVEGEIDEGIPAATAEPRDRSQDKAAQLLRIRGIGTRSASLLAAEVFYRTFENRRQLAGYFGLTPTPYNSGSSVRDQGISKAGNARARHAAIELAWMWIRHQPSSALTLWFRNRVGDARGRVKRIAIVALARKLMVALWRYLETGLIPTGAAMRA